MHVVETAEEWEQCVPQLALGAEKVCLQIVVLTNLYHLNINYNM